MHPIKPKQLFQQTAEETGFTLPTVTAVVGFFYSELNRSMGSCKDINFTAPGLGTFVMNRKRTIKKSEEIRKKLSTSQDKLSERQDSVSRKQIFNDRVVRVTELDRALELLEDQEIKRLEIKQRRNQKTTDSV